MDDLRRHDDCVSEGGAPGQRGQRSSADAINRRDPDLWPRAGAGTKRHRARAMKGRADHSPRSKQEERMQGLSRRDFLRTTAAVGVGAAAAGLGLPALVRAQGGGSVKVGVLHSLSGTMAISEVSLRDVVLMA